MVSPIFLNAPTSETTKTGDRIQTRQSHLLVSKHGVGSNCSGTKQDGVSSSITSAIIGSSGNADNNAVPYQPHNNHYCYSQSAIGQGTNIPVTENRSSFYQYYSYQHYTNNNNSNTQHIMNTMNGGNRTGVPGYPVGRGVSSNGSPLSSLLPFPNQYCNSNSKTTTNNKNGNSLVYNSSHNNVIPYPIPSSSAAKEKTDVGTGTASKTNGVGDDDDHNKYELHDDGTDRVVGENEIAMAKQAYILAAAGLNNSIDCNIENHGSNINHNNNGECHPHQNAPTASNAGAAIVEHKSVTGTELSVTKPPVRPLSAYNLFFHLERQRILELSKNSHHLFASYDEFLEALQSSPSALQHQQHHLHHPLYRHHPESRSHNVMMKKMQLSAMSSFTVHDVAQFAKQHRIDGDQPKPKRKHRKTHGKISFTDLARTIALRWKRLSSAQRAIFKGYFAVEMNRYKQELDQYNAGNVDTSSATTIAATPTSKTSATEKSGINSTGTTGCNACSSSNDDTPIGIAETKVVPISTLSNGNENSISLPDSTSSKNNAVDSNCGKVLESRDNKTEQYDEIRRDQNSATKSLCVEKRPSARQSCVTVHPLNIISNDKYSEQHRTSSSSPPSPPSPPPSMNPPSKANTNDGTSVPPSVPASNNGCKETETPGNYARNASNSMNHIMNTQGYSPHSFHAISTPATSMGLLRHNDWNHQQMISTMMGSSAIPTCTTLCPPCTTHHTNSGDNWMYHHHHHHQQQQQQDHQHQYPYHHQNCIAPAPYNINSNDNITGSNHLLTTSPSPYGREPGACSPKDRSKYMESDYHHMMIHPHQDSHMYEMTPYNMMDPHERNRSQNQPFLGKTFSYPNQSEYHVQQSYQGRILPHHDLPHEQPCIQHQQQHFQASGPMAASQQVSCTSDGQVVLDRARGESRFHKGANDILDKFGPREENRCEQLYHGSTIVCCDEIEVHPLSPLSPFSLQDNTNKSSEVPATLMGDAPVLPLPENHGKVMQMADRLYEYACSALVPRGCDMDKKYSPSYLDTPPQKQSKHNTCTPPHDMNDTCFKHVPEQGSVQVQRPQENDVQKIPLPKIELKPRFHFYQNTDAEQQLMNNRFPSSTLHQNLSMISPSTFCPPRSKNQKKGSYCPDQTKQEQHHHVCLTPTRQEPVTLVKDTPTGTSCSSSCEGESDKQILRPYNERDAYIPSGQRRDESMLQQQLYRGLQTFDRDESSNCNDNITPPNLPLSNRNIESKHDGARHPRAPCFNIFHKEHYPHAQKRNNIGSSSDAQDHTRKNDDRYHDAWNL